MKLFVAAGAFVLTAGLASAIPATADTAPPIDPANPPTSGPALKQFTELPGQDIARIDPATPTVRSGEVDRSPEMSNIARVPLSGPFAQQGAFGTDLAFTGDYAIAGNYLGFTVYDTSKPAQPTQVSQVQCAGSQNDVSVYGDLLVLSVDSRRSNDTCTSTTASAAQNAAGTYWEGIRVFDIKDPAAPRLVKNVETACGSHTHTLAPSKDGKDLFVYVSSYGPSPSLAKCQPPHDKISIVKVPVQKPQEAAVVSTPVLFPDGGTTGDDYSSDTSGCHDITAFPSKDIAAGACMGDGILMDIKDRANPRVIDRVSDTENFAFWHSATFSNNGKKIVFTDELGGGGGAECNSDVGPNRGANGIYDVRGKKMVFRSYYKIPREQADTENCVAHNGSLVPVPGRDIMVQAWYQGGTSVFEFTNSGKPRELQHFDRGAISDTALVTGGSWSSYWYNGYVYSSDITRGLEVFKIDTDWADKAAKKKFTTFNAQSQPSFNG